MLADAKKKASTPGFRFLVAGDGEISGWKPIPLGDREEKKNRFV
jgi:hypothetical protein